MGGGRKGPICVEIVRAIANYEGVPVTELGFSLDNHIDTAALGRLNMLDNAQWAVQFQVDEHDVAVRDDRTIWIDGYEFEKIGD